MTVQIAIESLLVGISLVVHIHVPLVTKQYNWNWWQNSDVLWLGRYYGLLHDWQKVMAAYHRDQIKS